ncbi:diguanylate cyclase [Planosporangium thailandense]|uniref:Diguanylate cyclase n=1 Tax=Planosporangium thailandense TaxID=765197 RepID=A0ABX0Y4T7_9ACTN|nr:diguanylate cyclase [Planosporangium thailandense]NJC72410.1 diguanylate cyclase [Planosporangium thailandense]
MSFEVGTDVLPGVEVVGELGRGAETIVYRVRRLGVDYALKLLTSSTVDVDRALAALRREAALLACVDHPLLPRIFDVGRVDAGPYLLLELIEGGPLTQALRDGGLDEARTLRLATDLAGPLAAVHRAGLVHRDVKPDNILLGADGTARLIDFGLAARGGMPDDAVAGTLVYTAPEQTGMLKRPVDGRSDLYALGAVLYECLTGVPPYQADDAGDLIRLHATAPVPDVRTVRPDVSPTFAAIIAKLLAKDPDDRYAGGEHLLADLERLRAEPDAVFPPGATGSGGPADGEDRLVGQARELQQLTTRWHRARAGRGGVALVEGQPGAGKTRLVRELSRTVRSHGQVVLQGRCVPDDPVPLAPLRAAIEQYLRTVDQLPPAERAAEHRRIRRAVGPAGGLLRALSPMLAALVSAPELGDDDRAEQFTNAAAAFLVDLAETAGGAVLHLDDVQWLDAPSRRVLQQLAVRLSEVPLLVVATARDDVDSEPAVGSFRTEMGEAVDLHLRLGPLDDQAVAELVMLQLGSMRLSAEVTRQLLARVGDNPLAVVEYMRAVIDAGLMSPSWDGWQLDLPALDRLELPGDALDLVLKRIDGLGAESRRLLAAGAALGTRFSADLVARVCDVHADRALDALAEAEGRRLLTAADGGYVFLHNRIREALLAELSSGETRRLHQRIAEALDGGGADDPEHVYATARHYARGEADRTPERVFATSLAAGRLALADHAPAEALAFLEAAAAAAAKAGITPDADFHRALGVACSRSGRFVEALEHLDRALRQEPTRLRRADIRLETARVHTAAWDPERAWDTVCQALAELGTPVPRRRFAMVLTALAWFVAGLAVGVTRIGFGGATGERRERYRVQAMLYDLGAYASTVSRRVSRRVLVSLRAHYVVNRLGRGAEYTRHVAGFGLVAAVAGRPRLARRIFDRAAATAAAIGDPTLVADVEWKRGVGAAMGGADNGELWQRALTDHERWLELGDYLTGVSAVCLRLVLQGRARDAERWYDRGAVRLASGVKTEGATLGTVAAVVPALLGRPEEAEAAAETLRGLVRANPGNRSLAVQLLSVELFNAVERGDLGASFEDVARRFADLRLKPRQLLTEQRTIYVDLAMGRLAQCREGIADPAERARQLAAAERAVKELARAAGDRILRAYVRVARAELDVLRGRPERALRDLLRAQLRELRLDAPLVAYETARVRARAYRMLGEQALAEDQAHVALMIATAQRWLVRARWVRAEFGVTDVAPVAGGGMTVTTGGSAGALNRRRLAALQQVSLAAATVLDPRRLARVALDQTVRILGAERAYLFLVDAERDQLVPHLGRDGEGNDIAKLTGYSASLVERVRDTCEPLVVTGSEEGVALGSRSVLVHGLRSIMIAPVQFDGRLLGVVYLDSRVAKGIFTAEDVDILTAITHHVAVSLETARAAQLEVAAQTARRQRDVAETLRAVMSDLTATLDPDEVMHRLLDAATGILPGNTAALLGREGDRHVLRAGYGSDALSAAVGRSFDPADDAVGLAGLEQLDGPHVGADGAGWDGPLGALLGKPRSWLAVPVVERGEALGVLLVASKRVEPPQDAQVQVVAALVGQGMTAYENARLFSQVRRMATIDGLTGLYNRNHFFAEAGRLLQVAQRHQRPAAVIMLDVDHFKRINDTYGHPVGDEVIRTVAARLRESVRDSDLVGRYGGEEFVLVTPETGAAAAGLAERLREAVGGRPVETDAGPLTVTISVGMAHVDRGEDDLSELLGRADTALYAAKQKGRNRVEVLAPPSAAMSSPA